MLQFILITAIGLLVGNTVADILVQPGYDQPHSPLLSQQIVQPLSTLPHVPGYGTFQQHSPGYHLELHPVYGHLEQSLGGLGYRQGHDLSPYQSREAHKRFHYGGLSGLGIPGTQGIISPHIPVPTHRRFRRSAAGLLSEGVQREKRENVAVAEKSTLNGDNGMVVDLLNHDEKEKRVEVRQSKNDQAKSDSTLLGLNPARMYPPQNQYRFAIPSSSSYQQIVNQEPASPSQINSRAVIHEQATPHSQAATTRPNISHGIKPEFVLSTFPSKGTNLVLDTSPWTTAEILGHDQQRNYPDPRPMSDTERIDHEKSRDPVENQQAKSSESSGDDKVVGLSHHHKIKTTTHLHHGKFRSDDYENEAYTPCTCQDPVVTVYNGNDEATNNLQLTQLGVQQPASAVRLASLTGNVPPNGEYYVVAPQTYSSPIVYSDCQYSGISPAVLQYANTFPIAGYQLI